MENKFVEFIKNNKKVIILSVAVGVVLVLGFGWYSYNQHQAEQQAKVVQLEKDSKSDKEQVDKLFESFDASSDESISKLKELSETSLKTDAGKDYLNNKVKESSKAIVDFHIQKGLTYDEGALINLARKVELFPFEVIKGNFYIKFKNERVNNINLRTSNCTICAVSAPQKNITDTKEIKQGKI